MGHAVTLGGDRLGSGNKNKIALNDYMRSTHNLSQKFTSSMQCGTLYPFMVLPAMRGDKFEIDLTADCRTIPTKGPLFGSFKMQVDLFQSDIRLYQAILHNNPLAIGLKMGQVKFPVQDMWAATTDRERGKWHGFSNSCLMKYLGLSGLGTAREITEVQVNRKVNAIPMLAYYEIFKTYYANKQEEKAYIIGNEILTGDIANFGNANFVDKNSIGTLIPIIDEQVTPATGNYATFGTSYLPARININTNNQPQGYENKLYLHFFNNTTYISSITFADMMQNPGSSPNGHTMEKIGTNSYVIYNRPELASTQNPNRVTIGWVQAVGEEYTLEQRGLTPFALENIDQMRLELLSHHQMGVPFTITPATISGTGIWGTNSGKDQTGLPYIVNCAGLNDNPLNGLCIKTYQSDLYNNWVNTEWIDGDNGIAAITAISTAEGSIKIDSINFAEKLYNMMNRIAVSDGSYEGWQDAVYTETPKRHIESPIYLGGMSSEIVFEEIVQTSEGGDNNPLGTLAGKGRLIKRKGGRVVVKTNEAAFIIGIVSLTPRINYSQGNEFYMTDLLSMDDFHKPALDGIGFQNLIGERMAWWDTKIYNGVVTSRSTIGKIPAWMEYMTAVDKTFGDFAETDGRGFMALNRHYDATDMYEIADATTYIDPRKYNYAFAVTDIDAQNFWVQIYSDIKARRIMSAKQIPNI